MNKESSIREAIFQAVESIFSIQIHRFQSIHRGWKNLKWMIETTQDQSFFVKVYSYDRYEGKLDSIEQALAIQDQLRMHGVCCPEVYVLQDGKRIYSIQNQISFSVMEVRKGEIIGSGTANIDQMASLGATLGKLHQVLYKKIPAQPIHWRPTKETILNQWKKEYRLSQQEPSSEKIYRVLETQKLILDHLDFSIFDSCKPGWTHWDFQTNNLLFRGKEVSAILDFDRMKYAYPELDVARVLLSGGLNDEGLAKKKIDAFLHAYQTYQPFFTQTDLNRALLLLWTIESPWWFRANIEEWGEVPRRFFKEICWIQQHWQALWKMAVDSS